MNGAIMTALTYLNDIEVRGERNCTLLVAAIKELKPLQNMRIVTEETKGIEIETKEDENK